MLIASDDGAYARDVAHRLRQTAGPHARVDVIVGNRSECAAGAGGGSGGCVWTLLRLVLEFGRAAALVVSLRSNMGGFLFSWRGGEPSAAPLGALGGARGAPPLVPPFVDVDGVLRPTHLANGSKYFCSLRWGSRAGLCHASEAFSREESCPPPHGSRFAREVGLCCTNATPSLRCRACPRAPPVCSIHIGEGWTG